MLKGRKFLFMSFAVLAFATGVLAGTSSGHAGPGGSAGYPAPGPGNGGGYGK